MRNVYANVEAVGMDVHYKFSTVTMRDACSKVIRRERLDHRDRAKVRQVLSRWPKEAPIVMEASFGWAWLAELAQELGLQPQLSNCYKLEQMRKSRGGCKTNKKDADLLSLLPFEKGDWWKVWMVPADVRDQREWMRFRASMVGIQTETKNRISAMLHRHGIIHDYSDLFGLAGRKYLADLCLAGKVGEVELLPGALAGMRGMAALLDHVRGQLAKIARELRRQMKRSELAQLLKGIPGIALILAHTLISEIGKIERFASHRALANYSLLAPISDDTGEDHPGRRPIGRRLGHRGNHTLKWSFIEAAHGAVRSGGRWREMFDRATQGGKKDCNRGYIKVARELAKVVYVVWSKNVPYAEQPPQRPSLSRRQRMLETFSSARSGTGQPFQPMAGVH